MAVVTIARLTGSGGDIIASKVARELGYDLVDASLISKVAEQAGVSLDHVRSLDEKTQSRAVEWLLSFITPRIEKIMTNESQLNPEGYIEYVRSIILGLADKGNMVIVGRGGQFILRERENAFHVRLVANMETRVYWLKQYYAISDAEAADRIRRSDTMRRNFIERYFRANWDDPLAYNMIINTSRFDIDEVSADIVDAVRRFSLRRDYIPGVRDRRVLPDRRGEDRRKGDRRSAAPGVWTIRDTENALMKEGRPVRTLTRPDRRKAERRQGPRRKDEIEKLKQRE
jgi:cytidylate kinase